MSSAKGIRVMLVDDHPITRRGLQEVLRNRVSSRSWVRQRTGCRPLKWQWLCVPDVIVMDVIMPRKNGVEACRDILDLLPDTKVLILTASTEDDAVIEAIAAGATGFVQKYSGGDELLDAIRQVAEGQLMFPNDSVKRAFTLIRSGAPIMPSPKALTKREQEVLTHFARGRPYSGIAEHLGVTTVTVRNTIYRIKDKLGLESKQEIVVWAVRNGLLDDDEVAVYSRSAPRS